MSPASTAISIESLSYRFGTKVVLERLNLDVIPGECVAVLGTSGSGKSTLIRVIAGLLSPQSGSVRLMGIDQVRTAPHLRDIAVVSQAAGSYDHLTVKENLQLAERLSLPNRSTNLTPKQKEFLLDQLEVLPLFAKKPPQLSGGQAQRVAIARAFISGRSILLMDEPMAHLHEGLRDPIRSLMRKLQKSTGRTCIYITHDSAEACQLADRIAVLSEGTIQQIDRPHEIYRTPANHHVANLFGRPPIQWFDPRSLGWNDPRRCVGVRPTDWKILEIENDAGTMLRTGHFETALPAEPTFRWHGTVQEIQKIESDIWIEVAGRLDQGLQSDGEILLRVVCSEALHRELPKVGRRVTLTTQYVYSR
ncbi:MAG: ABC transporter ATP-binding protein [Pirellula sp.]|jgi:ABC-type sugar transport system ATPase subunit